MITLPSPDPVRREEAGGTHDGLLRRDLVVESAVNIGATLSRDALWHDGRALWLGDQVETLGSGHRVVHRACGGSLYDGTAGIGWFLAHLAAATGGADTRADALGAFRHALAAAPDLGPGLHDGAAGVGWAVLDGGVALDDPIAYDGLAVLTDALRRGLVTPLPAELIGGRAGLILAALAGSQLARRLERESEADLLLDLAGRVGRQLLDTARRGPTGWTWPSAIGGDDESPLCGLGHGTSGPVLAAAHLGAVTGEPAFSEAAREGARWERGWLRADAGWPDLRGFDRAAVDRGDEPSRPFMWCHGAGGIGMTRIRAARLLDDPALEADAAVALRLATLEVGALWRSSPGTYAFNFSLCHGAGGLADMFVAAASELGNGTWLGAAAAVVQAGLAARADGAPWICGVPDGTDSPSLMLGLAGTGTALLRLADPGSIASPLTIAPVSVTATLS